MCHYVVPDFGMPLDTELSGEAIPTVPGVPPAGDNVDPGRVDIFMPKDIRQTRDILFFFIKSTGKQVS